MKNPLRTLVLIAVLSASVSAQAAKCVQVTLQDPNGLPVATVNPLVGLAMPEGDPLVDYLVPGDAKIVAGAQTPCPDVVVASVDAMFREACLTEQSRKATAAANNSELAFVEKRCKDIYSALNAK
jgi:hypothetical protein